MAVSKKSTDKLEAEVIKLRKELDSIKKISLETKKKFLSTDQKFKNLYETAFEAIVIHQNGIVQEINNATCTTFEYPEKQIVGKPIFKFIHPEYHSKVIEKVKNKDNAPYEVVMLRKGNKPFWVKLFTKEISYNGLPARVTAVRDISELKENEDRIIDSERKVSILSHNFPGVAYRCKMDKHFTMEFLSDGFLKLTGYKPKDFINNNKYSFNDIIHPDDVQNPKLKKALKEKKIYEIEYRIITAKNEIKWVWEKGQGIYNNKGKLLFLEGFITDINEKKQFEIELRRSRKNYKQLFDSSHDGIIIHLDGKILFSNKAALKMIDVESYDELKNKSVLDYILPECHQTIIERIKEGKKGIDLDFAEIKILTKNNEVKLIETKPMQIEFDGLMTTQVILRDITPQKELLKEQLRAQVAEEANQKLQKEILEREKKEQELRESEERYKAIYDQAYIGISKVSPEGKFLQTNQHFCNILGYTNDEISKMSFVDITDSNDVDISIGLRDKLIKGELEEINFEKKYIHKLGHRVLIDITTSLVRNADGSPSHFITLLQDISERRKIENEKQKQRAKLNAIFESGSHIIWTADRDSYLTSFNQNFKKFIRYAYDVEIKLGMSLMKDEILISSQEYNSFWMNKHENALNGVPQYFEAKLYNKEGSDVWYEIFLNPIFDENNQVIEVSGIGHNITEKIVADEKIKHSLQEKDILLKEVHHRVKNNLQVISSILNLQSSYIKDQNTLNILRESQNRIKSMAFIHECLYQTKDFSSINFSEYIVNLTSNLVNTYSDFEIKQEFNLQSIFLNLDLAIPSGLIINELFSNALKYAFNSTKKENIISIELYSEEENIKLVISDNGIGLPNNIDFRNTESLGLQLVVSLVDQLNGDIQMDNLNGTKYTIIFKQIQTKNKK